MNSKYENYLLSKEWAQIKLDLYIIRGRKCEVCAGERSLQIHHLTYKRIYNEEPEDLVILCRKCHVQAHKKDNVATAGARFENRPSKSKRRKLLKREWKSTVNIIRLIIESKNISSENKAKKIYALMSAKNRNR